MKKLMVLLATVLLIAGALQARIDLPETETITLDNGLIIEVIQRGNLPLFSIGITFRAGSIADPSGKEGLAGISNEMLMRGTPTRTDRQIVEQIAFVGGTLGNFCDRESAGFRGEFLSDQGEIGFEILADILTNSSVAEEELEKIRTRTLANIQSDLDDPSTVATTKMFAEMLGDNPYAHNSQGTLAGVGGLTRDDVTSFLADYYTPDNCLMVVCGDISPETVRTWATEYFTDWKGTASAVAAAAAFPPINGKEVIIYNKEDATQTQIRVGGPGLSRHSADYFDFEVARTVYAGSFTSRLVNEIRVNRGLSYGVRCRGNRYADDGIVYVSTFTKNESVGEVLEIIMTETNRIQTEHIPDSELVGGINYQAGLYPLDFETSDDMVRIFSNLWLYGLDKAYYQEWQESLRAVTPEGAMAASGKYLPKDNYRIILVGKADEIQTQAETYGNVTIKEIAAD